MLKFALPLSIILTASIAHADETLKSITIYGNSEQIINQPFYYYNYNNYQSIPGYAYVTYEKDAEFKKGQNTIIIENLPETVDQNSISLLNAGQGKTLLEQYVSTKPLNATSSKEASVVVEQIIGDKTIEFKGKLLPQDANNGYGRVALLQDDGKVTLINNPASISFSNTTDYESAFSKRINYPQDNQKPNSSLFWIFESTNDSKEKLKYSYKTSGISWATEYRMDIPAKDKDTAKLTGWANIINFSGQDYKSDSLKLIAGQVNSVASPSPRYEMAMAKLAALPPAPMEMQADSSSFRGSDFSDLQSYTIAREVDLPKQTTKKIKLFDDKPNVKVERQYIVDANSGGNQVSVNFKLINKLENGLGNPLPAGKFRVFEADEQGAPQFIGEANIQSASIDDDITVTTGKAFDVRSIRTVTKQQMPDDSVPFKTDNSTGRRWKEGSFEVKYELSNQKKTDIKVKVQEPIYQSNWKITQTNFPANQKNANTAEFDVPVKAGAKEILIFKVEYTQ